MENKIYSSDDLESLNEDEVREQENRTMSERVTGLSIYYQFNGMVNPGGFSSGFRSIRR